MPNYPTVPVLITARACVLIGTPEQPDEGFICSIESTDDRDRATLTTNGITMTAHGLDTYIKCLAAGFNAALEQARENNTVLPEELLPLLLKYIETFKNEGAAGRPIVIVTPGPQASSN